MEPSWWQNGIIYQVYPRSFQDSDGDGIGDLKGIIKRLDYLAWLGVKALWISPIYVSPMDDFGYDVADYCAVDPVFGTLDDFDHLVAESHRRNLKVILDFVPNHTSDRHPWFLESRSSRSNPKRDWYIWRDARRKGDPPTNWLSNFGGSAWEWDPVSSQYYYHSFLRQQPDLNWRNEKLREAMYGVLRFWLDRGVDGFRIDVLWLLIKDDQFRNNPINPDYRAGQPTQNALLPVYTADRPEVHDVIAEMRRVVDAYEDRVLIGEIYLPVERMISYYGDANKPGVQLPFNFQLIGARWSAREIGRIITEYKSLLPANAWPNWVLGNHDNPRIASRIGGRQARIAAMLLLTLRGTPTIYYGEEIGMKDVPISPSHVQDPYGRAQPGLGLGRDPERSPMQWDASTGAGFTTKLPWLPLASDYTDINVERLAKEPASLLMLYRELIALRKRRPALSSGSLSNVAVHGDVLTFERRLGSECVSIVLNFSNEPTSLDQPIPKLIARLAFSSRLDGLAQIAGDKIFLRGGEGIILDYQLP